MPSPLFVLGAGRCGSTLLHELLAAHPAIALTNAAGLVYRFWHDSRLAELPASAPAGFTLREPGRPHGINHPALIGIAARACNRHALQAIHEIYAELFPGKEYRYWGDRLADPQAAPALAQVLPDARFVVVTRDPRDMYCARGAFGEREETGARELSPAAFCAQYRALYEGLLRDLQPRILVRYEDLLAAPHAQLGRVLDFLGLDPTPETTAAAQAAVSAWHGTARSPQASIGRWRRELLPEEQYVFARDLVPLLVRFGYEPVATP